jgi:pimeloyl-ACP methyl ester carboxylesterase
LIYNSGYSVLENIRPWHAQPALHHYCEICIMHKLLMVLLLLTGLVSTVHADVVALPYHGMTLNANLVQAGSSWPGGPVILMTHGTLAHRGMEIMSGLQDMFAERGISSLAINLGLGLDNRADAMYDCAVPHTHRHTDAVDEIGAWLDWLKGQGVKKAALLGHSRGGNQVARFAAAHPDPVLQAVFLVAPQTWDKDRQAAEYRKRYHTDLQPLLARAQKMVADGKGASFMDDVGFLYCPHSRVSAASFLSYYAADSDMDTPHLLPRIPVPVTVVTGSEDKVEADVAGKVRPLADDRHVSLVVIDGADHFFRDLYSEEIADVVAEKLGVE